VSADGQIALALSAAGKVGKPLYLLFFLLEARADHLDMLPVEYHFLDGERYGGAR
jgi:hypothetical protein